MHLTPVWLLLVERLARAEGAVVSLLPLHSLMTAAGHEGALDNVRVAVHRFRRAVADAGMPECIRNSHGHGYAFVGDCKIIGRAHPVLMTTAAERLLHRLIKRCWGTSQETLAEQVRLAVFGD